MPRTPEQFEQVRSERKKAILDAALRVFATEGYHSASISKVSKEAGISKGLMYNYFESKEELLKILIGSLLDEENDRAMEIIKTQPVGDEMIIELIQMGTKILKKKPMQWKLYATMANQPEVLEIIKERFSPDQTIWLTKLLEYFTSKGVADPMNEVQFFASTMLGMKLSYLNDPENFPIDVIEKRIINLFTN